MAGKDGYLRRRRMRRQGRPRESGSTNGERFYGSASETLGGVRPHVSPNESLNSDPAPADKRPVSRAFDVARMAIGRLLDVLAPPTCAACEAESVAGHAFCHDCSQALAAPTLNDSILDVPIVAAYTYTAPLKRAVARFKYEAHPELGRPLGRSLAESLPPLLLGPNHLLLPVPLHPRRLVERGYNQAALLAREAARASGARLHARALQRAIDTRRQVGLALEARFRNVAGAFRVKSPAFLEGRAVILIDDVVTTGATASACVAALRDAGAEVSAVIALARK